MGTVIDDTKGFIRKFSYTLYLLEHVVYMVPNMLPTQPINVIKLILD